MNQIYKFLKLDIDLKEGDMNKLSYCITSYEKLQNDDILNQISYRRKQGPDEEVHVSLSKRHVITSNRNLTMSF